MLEQLITKRAGLDIPNANKSKVGLEKDQQRGTFEERHLAKLAALAKLG